MRAVPGCAMHQALAAEAAGVVLQAVALARRRVHAQVTPLHVAIAMLSASSPAPAEPGLLRAACLRSSSHSHPLQCKALELCFNVALNRLPTAFHGGHGGAHGGASSPALSNALVAAFKRAQAHHRRGGSDESSPAPALLATGGHGGSSKVELEQLVVSILDDPSVSRVMREAGFSSSLVKANVAILEHESTPKPSPPSDHPHPHHTATKLNNGGEDAMRVLECMASGQHRCVVAVSGAGGHGDDGARAERAVKAVMDMVSKAELPQGHEYKQLACVQFVPLCVSSFRAAARAEVEAKAGDLRALAREAQWAGKGLVLVLQDLAFAADAWAAAAASEKRSRGETERPSEESYYCPVEHAVMEVSRLVSGSGSGSGSGGGGGRFWVLGFASQAVFMRCKVGQPSLAAVWGIHPVVVPGDVGLALSLSCCSRAGRPSSVTGWPPSLVINGPGESELTGCCAGTAPTWPEEPSIPPWLRRYHDPNLVTPANCGTDLQQDLWTPMRNGSSAAAARHTSELTLSFSPPSPAVSNSLSAAGYTSNLTTETTNSKSKQPWQWQLDPHQQLQLQLQATDPRPSPPESVSVQSSSSGGCSPEQRRRPRFTELTAENLKTLCGALEGPRVPPRCRDVAPAVASAVLRCRSGVTTKWREMRRPTAAATWLLFRGDDGEGKKAMAMELARLVFGSYADFACISPPEYGGEFTPVHSGGSSSGEFAATLKRRRRSPDDGDEHGRRHGCTQKFYEALRENPRRVIMIDGAEELDHGCIKEAIANGRVSSSGDNGGDDSIGLEDAIVLLSFDSLDDSSPRVKLRTVIGGSEGDEEGGGGTVGMANGLTKKSSPCFSLDLNVCAAGDEEETSLLDNDMEIGDDVDGVFFFKLPLDLSH